MSMATANPTSSWPICSGNTVSVLLGNGNGTFQAQQTFATGAGPQSVAVGDVTGDGIPDLVVANFGSSTRERAAGQRQRHLPGTANLRHAGFPSHRWRWAMLTAPADPTSSWPTLSDDTVSVLLATATAASRARSTPSTRRPFRAVDQPHRAAWADHQCQRPSLSRSPSASRSPASMPPISRWSPTRHRAGGNADPGNCRQRLRSTPCHGQQHHRQRHAWPEPGGQWHHSATWPAIPSSTQCTGSFQAQQTFATGTYPSRSVALGDLTGDGNHDLVVANA